MLETKVFKEEGKLSKSRKEGDWIVCRNPKFNASTRLFCFPYAGGGITPYIQWEEYLPKDIELCFILLPGRESRIEEPLYTDFSELLTELKKAIVPFLDKPFIFFGHSMGALLSFELTRLINKEYSLLPKHLFVSAFTAPSLAKRSVVSNLPDDEFFKKLEELQGTPQELLLHPEFIRTFTPIIRADFSLCESYVFSKKPVISCPITVFGGTNDLIRKEELREWGKLTKSHFKMYMFEGNHFFIRYHYKKMLDIISKEIKSLQNRW